MSIPLGLEGKAYYGTVGSTAGTLLENIKDVTVGLECGKADTSRRKGQGWRTSKPTLMAGTVEFEMVWDDADAAFTAIKTAFFARAPLAFKFLDKTGGQGLDADFYIMSFSKKEPLEEVQSVSVTLEPTDENRAPAWV